MLSTFSDAPPSTMNDTSLMNTSRRVMDVLQMILTEVDGGEDRVIESLVAGEVLFSHIAGS